MKTNENIFDVNQYNSELKIDLSYVVSIFIDDLHIYANQNNIKMNKQKIQNCINNFKEYYDVVLEPYYNSKSEYEDLFYHINDVNKFIKEVCFDNEI